MTDTLPERAYQSNEKAVAREIGEIPSQLDTQSALLGELEDLIEQLTQRLHPISADRPILLTPKDETPPDGDVSEIASRIRNGNVSLRRLMGRVRDLRDSLEL